MPENSEDLADVEPFEVLKSADETSGEFLRFVATLHPLSEKPDAVPGLPHHWWAADNADQHLHPEQEGIFVVPRARYCVIIGDIAGAATNGSIRPRKNA